MNLGNNKNGDEVSDYVRGLEKLDSYENVLVINVSSPNTPGLRTLQHEDALSSFLGVVKKARDIHPNRHVQNVLLLVKITPDLSTKDLLVLRKFWSSRRVIFALSAQPWRSRPACSIKMLHKKPVNCVEHHSSH